MATVTKVLTASGAELEVHPDEVQEVRATIRRYDEQFKFTNISDLKSLDNLIQLEVMIHRWSQFIFTGEDHDGLPIDDGKYQRMIKESSAEARQLRAKLGIDKVTRDAQVAKDDTASFIENLLRRAKQFGVHRNMQFEKVLTLFADVQAKVTLHENTREHPSEQQELGCSPLEIIEWLRDEVIPEFEALDEHFRNEGPDAQKLWIVEQ